MNGNKDTADPEDISSCDNVSISSTGSAKHPHCLSPPGHLARLASHRMHRVKCINYNIIRCFLDTNQTPVFVCEHHPNPLRTNANERSRTRGAVCEHVAWAGRLCEQHTNEHKRTYVREVREQKRTPANTEYSRMGQLCPQIISIGRNCVFPRSGTNCLTVVAYSLRSRRQVPPTAGIGAASIHITHSHIGAYLNFGQLWHSLVVAI